MHPTPSVAAAAAAAAAAANTAAHSIHAVRLHIVPRPRNLNASRQILRVLQGYGEVTAYRWLKNDPISDAPNSVMAIFNDEQAMYSFLKACPITFALEQIEQEETNRDEAQADADLQTSPSTDEHLQKSDPINNTHNEEFRDTQTREKRRQLIRIKGDVWRGHHRDWLERHPFWGRFQTNKNTIAQLDLSRKVPLVGLSDIDAKNQREIPLRIINARREEFSSRPTLRERINELRANNKPNN